MKDISIIIPVYNSEDYLSECLDSILAAYAKDMEIILVDDGSTDASYELCRRYQARYDFIRCFRQENGGVSSARNRGIREARGKYLMFVDSDDFIGPQLIASLREAAENADFAMCGYSVYQQETHSLTNNYRCPAFEGNARDFATRIPQYLSPPFLMSPCFKMFQSVIVREGRITFPENFSYGEDALFVFQYLKRTDTVRCVECGQYYYRKHGNASLSSGFRKEMLDADILINRLLYEFLTRNESPCAEEAYRERMAQSFTVFATRLAQSGLSAAEINALFLTAAKRENMGEILLSRKRKTLPQKIMCLSLLWRNCALLIFAYRLKRAAQFFTGKWRRTLHKNSVNYARGEAETPKGERHEENRRGDALRKP